MIWPQLAMMALSAYGANKAANAKDAAADSMKGAGEKAYSAGLYKPYGVTSGLGTSSFADGQSSFALDPRYASQQNKILAIGDSAYGDATGNYNDLAEQFYAQQRSLGAGSRQAEADRLGGSMFGTGTTGLQLSDQSQGFAGEGTSNPYANMFMNNFAQQDSQDRYNAFDRAQIQRQNDINVGNSMFNQSMSLDQAGLEQSRFGADLGQYRSTAANNAGMNLLKGYGAGNDFSSGAGMLRGGAYVGAANSVGDITNGKTENRNDTITRGNQRYSDGGANTNY